MEDDDEGYLDGTLRNKVARLEKEIEMLKRKEEELDEIRMLDPVTVGLGAKQIPAWFRPIAMEMAGTGASSQFAYARWASLACPTKHNSTLGGLAFLERPE